MEMSVVPQGHQLGECNEFFQQVVNELRFLFEDGGFSIVRRDEAHHGEKCLVILASAEYQLKLIVDRGTLELLIGPIGASRGWENTINGSTEWYGLYNFIEVAMQTQRRSPEEWTALGYRLFGMSLADKMQDVANLLAPIHLELATLFREGRLAEIKHELE